VADKNTMTPSEVENLFKSSQATASVGTGDDGSFFVLPEEEKKRRVSALKGILDEAQGLWILRSQSIDLIAEKLGDGSRDGGFQSTYAWLKDVLPPSTGSLVTSRS